MSDISSSTENEQAFENRPQDSPSLRALRDFVDEAAALPAIVSRTGALSTSELHALRFLTAGALGPVELSRHLGVSSAAASGVVDRLEERGYVSRSSDPDDKRRTVVTLTDAGREVRRALMAPMYRHLIDLDAQLNCKEREIIARYLRGCIEAMHLLRP